MPIGEVRDVCAGCTAEIVQEPDGRWVDADTGEGRCIWTTNRHEPLGALLDAPGVWQPGESVEHPDGVTITYDRNDE